jgi:hypothetical protein
MLRHMTIALPRIPASARARRRKDVGTNILKTRIILIHPLLGFSIT